MGLFDRLTGTRRPDAAVAPRPAAEVRAVLLAAGGPQAPYRVRNATPREDADLVAEWRVLEPAWHPFFRERRLERTLKIRMRLSPEDREVRALDEQLEVTWLGNTPRLVSSREHIRGQVREKSFRWEIGRGPDGRLRATETSAFDSARLKDPLRDAVLAAGWTWRGVLRRL
ncbi:hypothetical protein ACFYXV_25855 [Streptomyces sp. NPDC002181]|uniref:hypothetical protein n=1 Tax=unclassified Streptomyces TaxID=2593676 RepID=UPI003667946E